LPLLPDPVKSVSASGRVTGGDRVLGSRATPLRAGQARHTLRPLRRACYRLFAVAAVGSAVWSTRTSTHGASGIWPVQTSGSGLTILRAGSVGRSITVATPSLPFLLPRPVAAHL